MMQINALRPWQNDRDFASDIFKCILLNEIVGIVLAISLSFLPEVQISNIPALI